MTGQQSDDDLGRWVGGVEPTAAGPRSDTNRAVNGRWVPGGSSQAAGAIDRSDATQPLARTLSRQDAAPAISSATTISADDFADVDFSTSGTDHVIDDGPRFGATAAGALVGASSQAPEFGAMNGDLSAGLEANPYDAGIVGDEEIDASPVVDGGAAARRNAIEWVVVLVAAVLLALVLRAFLLQAFWIPSPSMTSTLVIKDRVLVNKLSYRFGDVERGEIVVFHRTDEEISTNPGLPSDVIKRVIALPGETIEIADNTVYINGQKIYEPYLDEGAFTSDYGPFVVPEEHLFVMGDNRAHSQDSRSATGPIPVDRVVGRAFVLFWPLNRIAIL